MTDEVTEIPRCCSRRIQSEVACRAALRPLTVPAIWIAPPNSSSFSVRVVLPASGCEMMAKVRLLLISPVLTSSNLASQPKIYRSSRLTAGLAPANLGSILRVIATSWAQKTHDALKLGLRRQRIAAAEVLEYEGDQQAHKQRAFCVR